MKAESSGIDVVLNQHSTGSSRSTETAAQVDPDPLLESAVSFIPTFPGSRRYIKGITKNLFHLFALAAF